MVQREAAERDAEASALFHPPLTHSAISNHPIGTNIEAFSICSCVDRYLFLCRSYRNSCIHPKHPAKRALSSVHNDECKDNIIWQAKRAKEERLVTQILQYSNMARRTGFAYPRFSPIGCSHAV